MIEWKLEIHIIYAREHNINCTGQYIFQLFTDKNIILDKLKIVSQIKIQQHGQWIFIQMLAILLVPLSTPTPNVK